MMENDDITTMFVSNCCLFVHSFILRKKYHSIIIICENTLNHTTGFPNRFDASKSKFIHWFDSEVYKKTFLPSSIYRE